MATIKHSLSAPCTPDRVRAALTTHAGLTAWWAKEAEMGSKEGETHTLTFVKNGAPVVMELGIDHLSEHEVRWNCTAKPNPAWVNTKIAWTFRKTGDTTEVTFEHGEFEDAESPGFVTTQEGWAHFHASLAAHLAGQPGEPW